MRKTLFLLLVQAILYSCSSVQGKEEKLKIRWPEEHKWKIISNQEDSVKRAVLIVPENESLQKWSILGYMSAMKNHFIASGIDSVMTYFADASIQESPKAKYYILEKDAKAKHFWGIFKVETPNFPNDPVPESQLWYIVQGDSTLYINFVAVKEKALSSEFVDKWTKVFKSSEFINK